MESDSLRLECLRLAFKGGQELEETLRVAKRFEEFVTSEDKTDAKAAPPRKLQTKTVGNLDDLK